MVPNTLVTTTTNSVRHQDSQQLTNFNELSFIFTVYVIIINDSYNKIKSNHRSHLLFNQSVSSDYNISGQIQRNKESKDCH